MKVLLFASMMAIPSFARAECDIYDSVHQFKGSMISTGATSYAGVFPGASDSTPYAGDLRDGHVRQGEKQPSELATVVGSHLLGLDGHELASFRLSRVDAPDGKLLATVSDPYSPSGWCESGPALAGVALFVIYPQPNPGP